jgi:hypothetical protein
MPRRRSAMFGRPTVVFAAATNRPANNGPVTRMVTAQLTPIAVNCGGSPVCQFLTNAWNTPTTMIEMATIRPSSTSLTQRDVKV